MRGASGLSFAVSLRNVIFGGSGGTTPSGGFSGVMSGIGIGIGALLSRLLDEHDRQLLALLVEGERQRFDVVVRAVERQR